MIAYIWYLQCIIDDDKTKKSVVNNGFSAVLEWKDIFILGNFLDCIWADLFHVFFFGSNVLCRVCLLINILILVVGQFPSISPYDLRQ